MDKITKIALPQRLSIHQAIEWTAQLLESSNIYSGHGVDNSLDEAAWLILHALKRSPVEPLEDGQHILNDAENHAVAALLKQRIETRKPTAYLTSKAWFCGLEFYVDERVLVPRSPIAELIINEFQPWLNHQPKQILDLCTGSGCIAIACAYAFPDAKVTGTDISEDALAVAAINAEKHQENITVQFQQADVFDGLPANKQYDLIVTNPPYVDALDMSNLPEEYRKEPELGLAAGDNGLIIVERILAQAVNYLTANGILIVEVGNSETALLEKYPTLPFIWLEFEYGGMGVFLITAEELRSHQAELKLGSH